MASRYWVGGTATWDSTAGTKWSATSGGSGGASVPTSSDDVYINGSSGAGTITISASSVCHDLDCTGFTGTLTHPATTSLLIVGSLTFSTAMTYTLGNATNSRTYFSSANSGNTITLNGKVMGDCTWNGVGEWTFMSAFTSTGSIAHSYGEINTNNQSVSAVSYNSNVSYTRTLSLGNSPVTLTGTSPWNTSSGAANLTVTANTATITFTGTGANIIFGSKIWNGLSLNIVGAASPTLNAGGSTFLNVTRTGTALATDGLYINGNIAIAGEFIASGNSVTNRLLLASNAIGTQRIITVAASSVNWANVDCRDIALSEAFAASSITGGCGDCGGNDNITFRPSATLYWKTTTTGIKLWSAAVNWFYGSNGTGGQAHMPLSQDDCVFDGYSIGAASTTVRIDTPRAGRNVSFADVTNNPTLNVYVPTSYYGSLTLASGMAQTFTSTSYTFEGRGNHTITTAGKSFNSTTINCYTGSYVLQDAWTLGNYQLSVLSGDFSANGYNVTCASWASTLTAARSIHMGSGTWTCGSTGVVVNLTSTGLTLYPETSTLIVSNTTATAKVINATGIAFGSVVFAGDNITITGSNSFSVLSLQNAGLASGLVLTSGTVQAIGSMTVNSFAGSLAKLSASTAGSTATLSAASGAISVDYVSLQDIAATGGASWYAGTHSTNVSGNSGWLFQAPGGTTWTGSAALSNALSALSCTAVKRAVAASGFVGTGLLTSSAVRVQLSSAVLTGGAGAAPSVHSIWDESMIPDNPLVDDVAGVELGVKFYSDVDGVVKGVRFYKASTAFGEHVVSLWSSGGVKLASANVPSEATAGWHYAVFASPVAITAGTTYVASYYTPNGSYAFDNNYFASVGYDHAPLHVPSNAASGGNGVFVYGSASAFPTEAFNASNYYVDVVFETAGSSTIDGVRVGVSAAPLFGVGSLSAAGIVVRIDSVSLTATGALTATGTVIGSGATNFGTFTGHGTLSADGIRTARTSVSLNGLGVLSASAVRSTSTGAALGANAALDAIGVAVRTAMADLSGSGTLQLLIVTQGHFKRVVLLSAIDGQAGTLQVINGASKALEILNARKRVI